MSTIRPPDTLINQSKAWRGRQQQDDPLDQTFKASYQSIFLKPCRKPQDKPSTTTTDDSFNQLKSSESSLWPVITSATQPHFWNLKRQPARYAIANWTRQFSSQSNPIQKPKLSLEGLKVPTIEPHTLINSKEIGTGQRLQDAVLVQTFQSRLIEVYS